MNVIIAGSTGMVGSLLLDLSLKSDKIDEVRTLVRRKSQQHHPKLRETIITDFEDYSYQSEKFKQVDIAYFCIGVYTGQVPDDQFKKITLDYAVVFFATMIEHSPNARICFLSAAGTDSKEKSRSAFARYKGMAENQLFKLTSNAYAFRPAYIYPVVQRQEPNTMYKLLKSAHPILNLIGWSIRSTDLANAMMNVGLNGAGKTYWKIKTSCVINKN